MSIETLQLKVLIILKISCGQTEGIKLDNISKIGITLIYTNEKK